MKTPCGLMKVPFGHKNKLSGKVQAAFYRKPFRKAFLIVPQGHLHLPAARANFTARSAISLFTCPKGRFHRYKFGSPLMTGRGHLWIISLE